MSLIKVWPYVIITVLVVPVISLEKVDPIEQTQNISKRGVQVPEALTLDERARPFFAGGEAPTNIPGAARRGTVLLQLLYNPESTTTSFSFVSVWDQTRSIPFYSAYKVTSEQAALIGTIATSGPNPTWKKKSISKAYQKLIAIEPTITRGHLNPAGLNSFDVKFRRNTFTLTNAAPMFKAMNQGAWEKYEGRIRQYAKCPCGSVRKGTLYLLTGTSNYGIKKPIGTEQIVQDTAVYSTYRKRTFQTTDHGMPVSLQIPRAIWTAGCCVWEEQDVIKAESFAVMCNNERDPDNVLLAEMSVANVELMLTDPTKGRVNLFPNFPGCRSSDNPDFELPL